MSYWSDGRRWVNSPGYTDGTAELTVNVNKIESLAKNLAVTLKAN